MIQLFNSLLSLITFLLFFFISPFPNLTLARGDPDIIRFRSPGLYPEGLTWDPSSEHFIVGSLRRGTFHSVSNAAVVETLSSTGDTFLPPDSTILGLAVDYPRRRLLAAVNSAAPFLAAFDIDHSSIRPRFVSLLPAPTPSSTDVANDVAFDPDGNAYVTNSGNNVIWKIDVNGTASIFSTSSLFTHYPVDRSSPYNHCGLNGVVYIDIKGKKGYLLVVQSNTGKMFKVDAIDGTATAVILPEDLTLADGIAVNGDGVVVVVSMNCAWFLKSDDNWGEGVVIDKIALDREGFPTSVTIGGGGRVYVIYGHAEEGIKGNVEMEREWFRIEEIQSRRESADGNGWAFLLIGLGLAYFLFWRYQMGQLVKNMDKKKS